MAEKREETPNSNLPTTPKLNRGSKRLIMPNYRRSKLSGGTFFFTVVTNRRRRILTNPDSRQILRNIIDRTRKTHPFDVDAWVLLPEHMHCIWKLPESDNNFSMCWSLIKSGFSKMAKALYHKPEWMTDSKQKHRESTIWQRRFWEHQIYDEDDYRAHMDYIHYNPEKHGLVKRVKDWPYSTFHRYINKGIYSENWGGGMASNFENDYGE